MLFADSVTKSYAGDPVLRDVSFTIGDGESRVRLSTGSGTIRIVQKQGG